ncbi:MAG: GGDEF domain-containing protein [Candidatus Acidiferrales bacterium]|jgi:diguanylate cyclase (GGDEF)-like protein
MNTEGITSSETGAEERTQEIRRGLQKLARHDWSLWATAVVVILSLSAAVASLAVWMTAIPNDPYYQFHISQSVRGLLGLVLLFSVYTLYQQFQLRRIRVQLIDQIEVAGQEQKRAEEFRKLSIADSLTGLHNRRFGEERLAVEISRAQRSNRSLTVLMIDLDGLKGINDQYGHGAGDAALKVFAERLTSATRGSDLPARIGGDEFLVLLPECEPGGVNRVLNRLTALEIEIGPDKIAFSYSAGSADYRAGESLLQLLERADDALYASKQTRKKPQPQTVPQTR